MNDAEKLIPVDVSSDLADLIGKFPLPEGVPDADMNQAEIAQALSVTVNTVGKWLTEPTFPIAQRGGQGKPYVLRLSHCWAWRQARDAADVERRQTNQRAIDMLQAKFLGMDVDDSRATLSPKERRALAEADLLYSKAALVRRKLVEIGEVVEVMEGVFAALRNAVEAMPDRLERELGLKPDQVELVQRLAGDILNDAISRIEDANLSESDIEDVDIGERLLI
ncbi:MAG: DUF1441 family protein [Marinibacterium sp.]